MGVFCHSHSIQMCRSKMLPMKDTMNAKNSRNFLPDRSETTYRSTIDGAPSVANATMFAMETISFKK